MYLNRGYPEVTVQPVPKGIGDGSKVELSFTIHEGPQILIDHVLIVGNQRTQPRDDSPRGAAEERAAALPAAGGRDAHASDLARFVPPRRHFLSPAAGRAEPSRRRHHRRRSAGDDHRLRRRRRRWKAARAVVRRRRGGRGIPDCAARVLPDEPAQPVREGPIDKPLHARQLPAKGDRRRDHPSGSAGDDGGYGFNEYLARVTFGERSIFGTDTDATITAGDRAGACDRASTSTGEAASATSRGASAARYSSAATMASITRSC